MQNYRENRKIRGCLGLEGMGRETNKAEHRTFLEWENYFVSYYNGGKMALCMCQNP